MVFHLFYLVKQNGPPKILFKKKLFVVGEHLIANCTTSRAKPHPHITWLINGKKVKRNKIVLQEKRIKKQSLNKIKIVRSPRHDMQSHSHTHTNLF